MNNLINVTLNENQGREMNEEEITELLKFLMTDYGRGYLAGLVGGASTILKILKNKEEN